MTDEAAGPNSWPDGDDLEEFNSSPVGYLAAIGVDAGAPEDMATQAAEELVNDIGAGRQIGTHLAIQLRDSMQTWAGEFPRKPRDDEPSEEYYQFSTRAHLISVRPQFDDTDSLRLERPSHPVHAGVAGAIATVCGILTIGMVAWQRPFDPNSVQTCRECVETIATGR